MNASSWIITALAGATNSGKTTLAERLIECSRNAIHIKQDDYFLSDDDPRHIKVDKLGHNNWEKLTAMDMNKMVRDVLDLIKRPTKTPKLLILDGFLILNEPRLSSLCHAKFYIDVGYEECRRRRLLRSYDPPDVPGYFEEVVWPESRASKEEALIANPDTVILNGELDMESILNKIINIVKEKTNFKICSRYD